MGGNSHHLYNLHLAFPAENADAHVLSVTLQRQIHNRLSDSKIADTQLPKKLGFGVLLGDHILGLRSGQIGQYAFGKSRIDPEKLERRNDTVAPERCAELRHSGIRIRAVDGMGHHH